MPPRVIAADSAQMPLPLVSGRFAYQPGLYRYEVVTESEIRQAQGDSAAARVRSVAVITLQLDAGSPDSLTANLTIDSAMIERDSLIPPPDSTDSSFGGASTFTLIVDERGSDRLAGPPAEDGCTANAPLLAVARDLVVPVPGELVVGATWADTATVRICRGGVPVTTGVVRSFEVLGSRRDADGNPLMRVRRATVFSLAGIETTEHGQIIALSGRGESEAVFELDLRGGAIRSAQRDGSSEVTVTYGRTTTPFTQRVTQRVRLLEATPRQPER